jgi:glucose-1-phosphate thymidylyltransferase
MPLPAIECLLGAFEAAGIPRACIVIRPGKEDIADCLGDGAESDLRLEYVLARDPPSPPFTLDAGFPVVEGCVVAMGFPDILFEPHEAFGPLLRGLEPGVTDAVLGLFPHPRVRPADLVNVDPEGTVRGIQSARQNEASPWTWGLAAWTPRFTGFLHEFVTARRPDHPDATRLGVGHVVLAAIAAGMHVHGEVVGDEPFLDIGTLDGLAEANRRLVED